MKKIVNTTIIAAMFVALWSCDSLIEEKVYTEITDSNLFANVSGCDAALDGVYAGFFKHEFFGNMAPHINTNLSVMYTRSTTQVSNNFTDGSGTAFFGNLWQEYYVTINRANDVIANVTKSTITEIDKNRILGEAYFLRSMLYFDLVRYFGGVPLRIVPTVLENINVPKSTASQVYEQIISDIEQAKKLMVEPGKQKPGRPNKLAAFALAQKVYLTQAGSDPSSPYWQKSINEGLEVFNSNTFRLVKPYKDLWDVKKQNSVESIFEIQNTNMIALGGSLTRFFLPNNTTLTPKNGTYGGRAKVNKEVYDQHVKQYVGDPRIDATYLDSSYVIINSTTISKIWPLQKTGANAYTFIMKYVDPDFVTNTSKCNFIYLRYADVLLMLAEAENEINGPANAYKYVNSVLSRARDRNGNGIYEANELQPADWSGMSKEAFRDRIMAERNYELLGELHEYFDVRRRGKEYLKKICEYHNAYPANITAKEYTIVTDDATMTRAMLLPIALSEMNTNSALKPEDQNPGY